MFGGGDEAAEDDRICALPMSGFSKLRPHRVWDRGFDEPFRMFGQDRRVIHRRRRRRPARRLPRPPLRRRRRRSALPIDRGQQRGDSVRRSRRRPATIRRIASVPTCPRMQAVVVADRGRAFRRRRGNSRERRHGTRDASGQADTALPRLVSREDAVLAPFAPDDVGTAPLNIVAGKPNARSLFIECAGAESRYRADPGDGRMLSSSPL